MSKIGFLFPGQGAQEVGMGRDLAQQLSAGRALYDRAAEVLGYDLAKLCFEGPDVDLDSTVYSQPALFVTSLVHLEWLKAHKPDAVDQCQMAAGLSLGEYTAMVFAGVLDFETGLTVVRRRGEAMQAASDARPSGMVSILGLDRGQVEKLCDECRQPGEILQVANLLCPGNIALSGDNASCEKAAERAVQIGAIKSVPLAVAGAFHTPIMQSAVDKLAAALADAKLSRPRLPVVSNVDARPHDDPEEIRQLLIRQVVSPVLWEDTQRYCLAQGINQFYEVGPGRVLRGLLKRVDRKTPCDGAP